MSRKQSKTLVEKLQVRHCLLPFLVNVNGQLFSALFHTLKHLHVKGPLQLGSRDHNIPKNLLYYGL